MSSPELLLNDQLIGCFRFEVTFFSGGGDPNPLDIRFQRVSGIASQIETREVKEGGENLYTHRLPQRVGYQNLVLERGFVVESPLSLEFKDALTMFKFGPSNVMVKLLSEEGRPLAAWMFFKAYPVRWATADLNASEERVLIDTLELAYTKMTAMRI